MCLKLCLYIHDFYKVDFNKCIQNITYIINYNYAYYKFLKIRLVGGGNTLCIR